MAQQPPPSTDAHESIVDQINATINHAPTTNSPPQSIAPSVSPPHPTTDTANTDHHGAAKSEQGDDSNDAASKFDKRKRRRLVELRDDELWHCPYYPCRKVYSMKSTASIQQHKKTCVIGQSQQQLSSMYPFNALYNKQMMALAAQQNQQLYTGTPMLNQPPPPHAFNPAMQPQQHHQLAGAPQQQYNPQQRVPGSIQQQIQLASSAHMPMSAIANFDPYTPHTASNTQSMHSGDRIYSAVTAPLVPNSAVPQQLHSNLATSGQRVNFGANINFAQLTHEAINGNTVAPANVSAAAGKSATDGMSGQWAQMQQPAQPQYVNSAHGSAQLYAAGQR